MRTPKETRGAKPIKRYKQTSICQYLKRPLVKADTQKIGRLVI